MLGTAIILYFVNNQHPSFGTRVAHVPERGETLIFEGKPYHVMERDWFTYDRELRARLMLGEGRVNDDSHLAQKPL